MIIGQFDVKIPYNIMSAENRETELQFETSAFINDLIDSDGRMVSVVFGEYALRVKLHKTDKEETIHCLTLLGEPLIQPSNHAFGCIGLRTYTDAGAVTAELINTNIAHLGLPNLSCASVEYDCKDKSVYLRGGGFLFHAGKNGDVFDNNEVMAVDKDYRGIGWEEALIQMAAQIALSEGATRLMCLEDGGDVSLYERALNTKRLDLPGGSWYYEIGCETPTDYISAVIQKGSATRIAEKIANEYAQSQQ